ncbi:hypothetical protein HYW75_05140 [Candidatus Pacearchaeota archaeon]|nr:hypothetical protein [Candidatus Pacearchaeota archaeon]
MTAYYSKDEWQMRFEKWKSSRNKKSSVVIEEKQIPIEIKNNHQIITHPSKITKYNFFLLSILLVVIVLLGYFSFKINVSTFYFSMLIASFFILCSLFFTILFAHKLYEKSIHHLNPLFVLSLSYSIIIANMLLSPEIYSLEWAFLGFLAITVVFYDFKIDSRFLILPALILLGYIPFLLIGAQKEIAETIAVYVYYFLVVGVGLQIVEYYKKAQNSIDFEKFIEKFKGEF